MEFQSHNEKLKLLGRILLAKVKGNQRIQFSWNPNPTYSHDSLSWFCINFEKKCNKHRQKLSNRTKGKMFVKSCGISIFDFVKANTKFSVTLLVDTDKPTCQFVQKPIVVCFWSMWFNKRKTLCGQVWNTWFGLAWPRAISSIQHDICD